MNYRIDISKLDKAEVLAALFNEGAKPMLVTEAREILKYTTDFDYLKGRVMKLALNGDTFDPWLYDRYNGAGGAAREVGKVSGLSSRSAPASDLPHHPG